MEKRLIIVNLVFDITLIFTILSHDLVTVTMPDASASSNFTIQGLNETGSEEARQNATQAIAILNETISEQARLTEEARQNATQAIQVTQSIQQAANAVVAPFGSLERIVIFLIVGIAILIVSPLLVSMWRSRQLNIRQFGLRELFRLLVAVGVTFTVILIIVYLNSLTLALVTVGPIGSTAVNSLVEIQKNFLTIIGTAFASLIAFYFGTRGTQNRNSEQNGNTTTTTTTSTGHETAQKTLEVIDINPIDGTVGVEINSPVIVTFSTSIRTSTINENTFSVKDANGNRKQGNVTPIDNNTTIRFNPVPPFNRNTRYTVIITKEIMDRSGATLAEDMEWHFTTVV